MAIAISVELLCAEPTPEADEVNKSPTAQVSAHHHLTKHQTGNNLDLDPRQDHVSFPEYGKTLVNMIPEDLPLSTPEQQEVEHWSSLLRTNLRNLYHSGYIDDVCYDAPRRKRHDPSKAKMATSIARLLYPAPADNFLGPLIKYQGDVTLLRRAIVAQRHAAEMTKAKTRYQPSPKELIFAQGPWDEVNDPISLEGVPALPMPVEISSGKTLKPFFEHLSNDGAYTDGDMGKEEYYETEMGEWEKGILYKDGRMDLCKKVVGPPHITALVDSLETNSFVRHFLLGNNMIGPVGATRIASFVIKHPDKIETWYLAGNCIDTSSFKTLATAFITSPSITNIWLKRNPLGPKSIAALVELITRTPHLRTLDLDQTELSDAGVAELFAGLAEKNLPGLLLRNLYLNGNGIGASACKSIATYLSSSNCSLQSLYASNNPVGDAGAQALAAGLVNNKSLLRLSLKSCGLKSAGATAIMKALTLHPCITTLDIGQSFATQDLKARYNYLDNSIYGAVTNLIDISQTLQYIDLGITALSIPTLESIHHTASCSSTLLVFKAEGLHGKAQLKIRQATRARLASNVKRVHGEGMSYEAFEQGEIRWLVSPKDVRLIDSSYRNRDAGLARRKLLRLDKWWKGEGELERVLNGE